MKGWNEKQTQGIQRPRAGDVRTGGADLSHLFGTAGDALVRGQRAAGEARGRHQIQDADPAFERELDGLWTAHFGWACQGAGFINPHELVHGWQAMTGNMAGQLLGGAREFPPDLHRHLSDNSGDHRANAPAFPASGRTYYHDRMMFEHLAQTPEYGPMFISKLWYDGPTATDKDAVSVDHFQADQSLSATNAGR